MPGAGRLERQDSTGAQMPTEKKAAAGKKNSSERMMPAERKAFVLSWLAVALATPLTLLAGIWTGGRSYILVCILIVIYSMVPFFAYFEARKPQARELTLMAVTCALSIASRVAFAPVPFFKPTLGIIMIAGIAFGRMQGFLVGSVTALVSNFIFGQGPWSPFQMLAYGLSGFVFGFLSDKGTIPMGSWRMHVRVAVSAASGIFIIVVAGPILDTSSFLFMVSSITPESIVAIYAAGLPVNISHGAATAITVFVLANPILTKLSRVKRKYGVMDWTGT